MVIFSKVHDRIKMILCEDKVFECILGSINFRWALNYMDLIAFKIIYIFNYIFNSKMY